MALESGRYMETVGWMSMSSAICALYLRQLIAAVAC